MHGYACGQFSRVNCLDVVLLPSHPARRQDLFRFVSWRVRSVQMHPYIDLPVCVSLPSPSDLRFFFFFFFLLLFKSSDAVEGFLRGEVNFLLQSVSRSLFSVTLFFFLFRLGVGAVYQRQ